MFDFIFKGRENLVLYLTVLEDRRNSHFHKFLYEFQLSLYTEFVIKIIDDNIYIPIDTHNVHLYI